MIEHEPNPENKEIARILAYLKKERYECIDDLPSKPVEPKDPNYRRYKCRSNWWQGITSSMKLLLHKNLIDDSDIQKTMSDFLAYVRTMDFFKFRAREELDKANAVLDIIIASLEKKLSED